MNTFISYETQAQMIAQHSEIGRPPEMLVRTVLSRSLWLAERISKIYLSSYTHRWNGDRYYETAVQFPSVRAALAAAGTRKNLEIWVHWDVPNNAGVYCSPERVWKSGESYRDVDYAVPLIGQEEDPSVA